MIPVQNPKLEQKGIAGIIFMGDLPSPLQGIRKGKGRKISRQVCILTPDLLAGKLGFISDQLVY